MVFAGHQHLPDQRNYGESEEWGLYSSEPSRKTEPRGHSSNLKAGSLRTPKELVFQFESQGRKRLMSQFNSQEGGIISYL